MRKRVLEDPELVELLAGEPELLAIADAVATTQQGSHPARARRPFMLAAAVALIGVTLFLWAPWQGEGGLVARAQAALGASPVVHLVLTAERPDSALVEIATGRVRPETIAIELWYQEDRDLLRVSVRRNGVSVSEILETPDRAVSSAGPVERASGVPGTLEPGVVALAADYRHALATGIARPLGDGTFGGRPVHWLELPTRFGTTDRVAIDRETLLPVAVRSPGSGTEVTEWTVREIETLSAAAGPFSLPAESAPTPSGGEVIESKTVGLGEAETSLGRPPLWAGADVAGLDLVLVESEQLSRRYLSRAARDDTGRGLMLLYGDYEGDRPDRNGAFVQLRQATEPEPAYGFLDGALALAPLPPPGFVRVEHRAGASKDLWIGSLRQDGLYVSITASSRELVLAAARSLSPLRDDR